MFKFNQFVTVVDKDCFAYLASGVVVSKSSYKGKITYTVNIVLHNGHATELEFLEESLQAV